MATNDDAALLTFKVGPFRLGVPAISVEAILNMPDFRSVPLSRPSVAGVFAYRDQVAVIICLRRKFGLPPQDDSTSGQLMLTRLGTGLTAFWVDEVLEMKSISDTNGRTLNTLSTDNAFRDFVLNDEQIFLRTDFETLYALSDPEPVDGSTATIPSSNAPEDATLAAATPNAESIMDRSKRPEPGIATTEAQPPASALPAAEPRPSIVDRITALPVEGSATRVPSSRPLERRTGTKASAPPLGAYRARASNTASGPFDRPAQRLRNHAAATAVPPSPKRVVPAILIMFGLALLLGGLVGYALWPSAPPPVAKVETVAVQPAGTRSITTAMTPDPHTPPLKSTEPPEIQSAPAIPNAAPAAVTAEESTVAAVTGHSAPLPPAPEPGTPKTPTATPDRLAPAPSAPLVWRVETDDFILTIERPQPGPYPAPTSAGGENQEHVHLVVPGDTLWHIARRYLGDPFRYAELAKLSRIKNPDLIYPGDIVRIQKKKIPAP